MMRHQAIFNSLSALAATLLVFAIQATPPRAAEIPLPNDPVLWQGKSFNKKGGQDISGVVFKVSAEGIVVGPWTSGEMSARMEYRKRLPLVQGMILGRYRTEGLLPRQAIVRIQFNAGDRSLERRDTTLAAAPEWRELAVRVSRPPAGADSITVGFGLDEKTDGRVSFTDLRVSDHAEPLKYAEAPELTRPKPPKNLASASSVRIERDGDAWWLVGTEGRPFFALGSTLPWAKRQGSDSGPERAVFAEMARVGLNCTAGSHDVRRWAAFNREQFAAGRPTLVQFYTLETRVDAGYDTLINAEGNNPGASQAKAAAVGGFNHAFPDPFDPRWEEALRKRVQEIAGLVRGKPWFGGWFADNERAHDEIHRYVWSKHCAEEFLKYLEKKYGRIGDLNNVWGSSFATFDDLLKRKPDPVERKGAMYEDFRLFSREILRRFNQTVLRTIREADPGHLVFSNRFMLGEIRDMLDNLDLYRDYDAIAVNIYPSNTAVGLDPMERQVIEKIHQRTGKPILISEWSVPALDSGLYSNPARRDWSYPQALETQTGRARQAAQILADFYNMPFVIGAHWFSWSDFDSAKRQANRGLFKATGQPWPELQDALGRLHRRISGA